MLEDGLREEREGREKGKRVSWKDTPKVWFHNINYRIITITKWIV